MRTRVRRQRRGVVAGLVLVALFAATLTGVAPVTPLASAGADGNEAPGAPLAARSITAGGTHTCAILPSGAVKCWGANSVGQLGQDSNLNLGDAVGEMATLTAVNLGAGRTATAITAGDSHTCALLDNATVKCWGNGANGRLGQDSTATLGDAPGEMAALPAVNLGAGRTATAITAGDSHTCALLDNATVKCWGNGANGRLGQDSTATLGDAAGEMAALPAVNLGAGRTATAITAGGNHTCALLDNATVTCWGFGSSGQLGQDSTDDLGVSAGQMATLPAVNLGAGRTATAITAGQSHTCALLDNATVKCWGGGTNGRLGQDSTASLGVSAGQMAALTAVNLGAGRTGAAVTAGSLHTCAVLDNGTVKCWGGGSSGQLGQGSTADLGDAAGEMATLGPVALGVPMQVRLTADQAHVSPGGTIDYHLAITNNSASSLTGITVADPNAPNCVQAVPDLAAGQTHTVNCSYTTTVADFPTRADTATVDSDQTAPIASNQVNVVVGFASTATAVAAGGAHTCALLDNGTVKCWGLGTSGQLGQDSTTNLGGAAGEMAALPAVNLGAGRTATAIATGDQFTCALLDNGTVKCWGLGTSGQLGQDSTASLGDAPGEMAALPAVNLGAGRTATAVTAGDFHTCALLDNATVKCWGLGTSGQLGQDSTATLGDSSFEMAAVPAVNLGAGRTATAVTAGGNHTCALLDDATVKCWGLGTSGQLGQDSTATLGDQPGEMATLLAINLGAGRTATAITAGGNHTCALLDNATVKCWGLGTAGQLGQDSAFSLGDAAGEMAALPAINLGAGRTATTVTAGGTHTCARLDNATVKCWGNGPFGRLGQGSSTTLGDGAGEMAALPAVNLGAGRTATTVTAGGAHTCAVLDNATVKCWGRGNNGQLGQDSIADLGDAAGEMAALVAVNLGFGSPGPASMTVALTADEATVAVGAPIHYHLTVTNTGAPALSGFTVTDPNAPNCVQAIVGLAAGAHQTIDCTHTPTVGDLGTYANTATVDTAQTAPVVSNTVNVAVTIPAGSGLVSGTVTETGSGTPVAGAVVAVLSTATFTPVAVATATGAGQYTAVAPVGSYFVYALDTSRGHAAGFHGAPSQVVVTAGNTTTANATLASVRGTLAGTVTETGSGTPLAGVLAMSVDLATGQPAAGDLTDNSGAYAIAGLTPGPRLLEFVDLGGAHTPEFFDNMATPTGASILNIAGAGTTTADAGLATQAGGGTGAHLTGHVTATVGGNLAGVAVMAVRSSDFSFAAGTLTDSSGNYDIELAAGTYKLAFHDPAGGHLFEWHDNQPASGLGSAATVTATNGTPLVTNAVLTPTTGVVSGMVTETGSGTNLANVFVVAIDTTGTVVGATTTAANGTYTVGGLPVGNVRIRFVDLAGTHVNEYFDNSPDYPGATLLPITAGSTTPNTNAALTPTP